MTEPEAYDDPGIQLKLLSRKMVHRLNNLLFVIDSYSQFIKDTHLDEETLLNLKRIEVATQQSLKTMQDWRTEADKIIPDPPGT